MGHVQHDLPVGDEEAILAAIDNPPGRSSIEYRIGDFARFREDLLRRAARRAELEKWTYRERGDPGFALLEMWAYVADILTFYQQRAANEAFVRTATQRDSLVRHAAMLGYRPRPGAAATTRVAFQLEKGKALTLAAGLKVQNTPAQGAKPLKFETTEALDADARLNKVPLLPTPVATDPFARGATSVTLQRDASPPPPNSAIALVGPSLMERKTVQATEDRFGRPAVAWTPEVQSAAFDPFGASIVPLGRSFRVFGWNAGNTYVAAVADATAPGRIAWEARTISSHALQMENGNVVPLEAKVDDVKPGSRVVLETTPAGASGSKTRVATVTAVSSGSSSYAGVDAAVTHLTLGLEIAAGPRVVRDAAGRLRALVVADDGAVWTINQNSAGSAWGAWRSLGGRVEDVAVGTPSDGRLIVVARASDGGLWESRENAALGSWSRWTKIATSVAQAEFLAESDGRLRLFALGTDGHVQQTLQVEVNGAWGAWSSLGGSVRGLAVARNQDGRVELFGPDADGAVWHAWEKSAGGEWTDWQSLGGQVTVVKAAINKDGRLEVFGRGTDGALWHAWQTSAGGAWSDWKSRGENLDSFAVAANADGRLEVFSGSAGGKMKHAWQLSPNGSWSNWTALQVDAEVVAAAVNRDGRIEAFARAADGALVHTWQVSAGGTWSGGARLGFPMWAVPDRRRLIVHEVPGASLPLWPFEYPETISGDQVHADLTELDSLDLDRSVLVDDASAAAHYAIVTAAESVDLDEDGIDDHLAITLSPALPRSLETASAHLLGNVAAASHGETVSEEVLGSGDATVPFPSFALANAPLTFLAQAGAEGGLAASLEVRVDGILWTEVPNLLDAGALDRVYCLEPDAAGDPVIRFGDGVHGARLPTGRNNVVATYRKGLGVAGNLGVGSISRPMDRPAGLRGVSQPENAVGGEDPEAADSIRGNAPSSVRTFGRIVSLRDFEDAARGFPGIAKAKAAWRWESGRRLLVLTVAAEGGATVEGTLLETLVRDLNARRDPYRRMVVRAHQEVPVHVDVAVGVDPAYVADDVLVAVHEAIQELLAFDRQDFGTPVHLSDLQAAIQAVPGVAAVDVDAFTYKAAATDSSDETLRFLRARRARFIQPGRPDPVQPRLVVRPDEIAVLDDPTTDAIVREATQE